MALPNPGWYTTGDIAVPDDEHDFGECQAGEYSTGKIFRLYNAKGSTTSDTMTSVKISIRDDDGGTDDIWVQQHWVQVKSYGGSTGLVDDEQTVYTAVGKNKELACGDIPSGEYRTLHTRCYPPTDAEETEKLEFQLRATYQQPQTSICNWITGLRGNGVVASTGNPFAMSTGGTTGTIPYEAGYALINNNEVYYGSSGTYNCSTGTSSTGHKVYLNESGAFRMSTGDVAATELLLYEATISSGVCTDLIDKRVYLAGLQSGTTGAMPTTPDLGDLYLDITNGKLYAAETSTGWTVIVPGATFLSLTDTPTSYESKADNLVKVTTGSTGLEFTPSTGIKLDDMGTPDNNTDLNATTGHHGLLPILSGSSGEYLNGDATFTVPPASDIEISEIETATYDDVQDWLDNTQSGGRVSGGAITDDSSGGITISSGTGFIQTTTGDIGLTQSFDWSADTIVSTGLTDDSANYVYIDYSTGAPAIKATATRGDIHLSDHFTLGRVYKSGTDLHILQSGVNLYNAVRRNHERLVAVRNFERASGGVISESAVTQRALTSTIGNFYLGVNKIITETQDTSTGGDHYFTTHYRSDATWTATTGQTQINNTQYNTSTGLADLTVNRYGVHWAYIHFESDIHVVYGQGDYTLAQAENAVVPDTLPSMVEDFGILASKIIIKQGSTGFSSVVTAYKVLFPVSSPPDHNDLGSLQGGAVNEYYHLNSANYTELNNWAGAVTLSTGGTISIPSGQEYQIDGSEVKLDEWATPSTGTALNATTGHHGLLPILSGTSGEFLNGDGNFTVPPGATGGATNFLQLTDTPANYTDDAGKYVKVTTGEDALEFATPPGGEANTASNAGTTGIGIYYQKSGVDLEFKAIHSTGNILVTDSTGTHTVNLDVDSTGILLDSLGTPSTGTTLDSSTGHHGLLPILGGDAVTWLDGSGAWTAPTASEVGALESSGAFTVNAIPQITSTGGVLKASPFVVTTGDVMDFGAHSAGFTEQAIATTTGTVAINWNSGNKALYTRSTGTAGGAATFSFTAPPKSMNLMLIVRGSTAGCTGAVTLPTVYWGDATYPTFSTGVSAIDSVAFYYSTGLTAYLGLGSANFSTV